MCKRFLLLLATVVLVGFGTNAFAATFSDTEKTPYATALTHLSEKGIVRGYSDGLARPYAHLNRVEAIKVLMLTQQEYAERVLWYKSNMPPLPLFSDVKQSQWFAPFVEAAFEAEIVKGYPDSTLRPGQVLRTEEAISLLMRAFGEEGVEVDSVRASSAVENRPRQWYTAAINGAVRRNAILQESRPLGLGQPVTRGQFFEMVYRMLEVQEKNILVFDDGRGAPVEPTPTVAQAPQTPESNGAHVINQPQPTASVSAEPHASEKYFAISMPSLGIEDLLVSHPLDPLSQQGVLAPLKDGVGHLFSYPGSAGKIMIYGHSSGYPWDVSNYTKIFRKVNQLNPGDKIYVTYEGKLYTYEVTFEEAIDANDTSPFNDNGSGEELILYTCWPPDSIAQRYLVHARPIDSVTLR